MLQSPQNNVIVKVAAKYIKNFTKIMRMAAIQNNTSIEPADFVQIVGEVVSVPRSICDRREYQGFSTKDIQVGDTAIFSYLVIFDFCLTAPEEEPVFKNRIWYKGEEFFLCDIRHVFATIRDTKIRMQNGYVMVEEMEKPSKIYLPQHIKKNLSAATAIVSHIGKNLEGEQRIDAEVGDKIYYRPGIIQEYNINGRKIGILSQHHIYGKRIANYSEIKMMGL